MVHSSGRNAAELFTVSPAVGSVSLINIVEEFASHNNADMTHPGHFDALRGPDGMRRRGNWPLLNRSWDSLLTWLDRRWWGSVSRAQIVSFLNRCEIGAGAIVVADCFYSTVGGLCSVTVKTRDGIVECAVVLQRGAYRCPRFTQLEFSDPVELMRELIVEVKDEFGEARVSAKPPDVRHDRDPALVSVTDVAEDMRDLIVSLKGGWWGYLNGSSPMSPDHLELIADLGRVRHSRIPAVAVCHVDAPELGYLFEVATAQGQTYKITFGTSGYRVNVGGTLEGVHSSMTDLLHHMSTLGLAFVSRPPPTLQGMAKSKLTEM